MLDTINHHPPRHLARHLVTGDRLVGLAATPTATLVVAEVVYDDSHLEMIVAATAVASRSPPLTPSPLPPRRPLPVSTVVSDWSRRSQVPFSARRVVVPIPQFLIGVAPFAAATLRTAERDLRQRRHLRPQHLVLLPQGGDHSVLGRQLLDRRAGRAKHAGETTDPSLSCPVLCQQPHRTRGARVPAANPGSAGPDHPPLVHRILT